MQGCRGNPITKERPLVRASPCYPSGRNAQCYVCCFTSAGGLWLNEGAKHLWRGSFRSKTAMGRAAAADELPRDLNDSFSILVTCHTAWLQQHWQGCKKRSWHVQQPKSRGWLPKQAECASSYALYRKCCNAHVRLHCVRTRQGEEYRLPSSSMMASRYASMQPSQMCDS